VHRRRDKRARPYVWDLPGGLMEPGESELGALTRELQEELGVLLAAGSASHLGRLTVGPAEEPALLSAWLVREWQGTPAKAVRGAVRDVSVCKEAGALPRAAVPE